MAAAEQPERSPAGLLDLRFLKFHVLLCNGVILFKHQLFCARARVFLRDIEKASASRRQQFDFLGYWFGHRLTLSMGVSAAAFEECTAR